MGTRSVPGGRHRPAGLDHQGGGRQGGVGVQDQDAQKTSPRLPLPGRPSCKPEPRPRSSHAAARRRRASRRVPPTSCTPSGSPAAPVSSGRVMAGAPISVQVVAKIGSPVPSDTRGATPGAASVGMASIRRRQGVERAPQLVARRQGVQKRRGGEPLPALDDAHQHLGHPGARPGEIFVIGLGDAGIHDHAQDLRRVVEGGRQVDDLDGGCPPRPRRPPTRRRPADRRAASRDRARRPAWAAAHPGGRPRSVPRPRLPGSARRRSPRRRWPRRRRPRRRRCGQ